MKFPQGILIDLNKWHMTRHMANCEGRLIKVYWNSEHSKVYFTLLTPFLESH